MATFRGREVPMTYEVIEHEHPERIVLRVRRRQKGGDQYERPGIRRFRR